MIETSKLHRKANRPGWAHHLRAIRPFVRKELRGRLSSAFATLVGLMILSWLAVAAIALADSRPAHDARIQAGLESPSAVCGGAEQPACLYDDLEEREVMQTFELERRLRSAILEELELRLDLAADAQAVTQFSQLDGDGRLEVLAPEVPRLDPLLLPTDSVLADWSDVVHFEPLLRSDIERRKEIARAYELSIHEDRASLLAELRKRQRQTKSAEQSVVLAEVSGWLASVTMASEVNGQLAHLARTQPELVAAALRPDAELWGELDQAVALGQDTVAPPAIRYESPVSLGQRIRLWGAILLGLGAFILAAVAPVVTATHTAREREAGTLPVLRMTGLEADSMAAAMIVGPNVFAFVSGGALSAVGLGILALGEGPLHALAALIVLASCALCTQLAAIALGDALGTKVNALVVGALMAALIVGPGAVGSVLTSFGVLSAGMLLGPLPVLCALSLGFSGLAGVGIDLLAMDEIALGALGYALAGQALVAYVCLHSWRRRVESGWAPLFRPLEGLWLGLLSIGASALTLREMALKSSTADYDGVNLLTLVACSFLVPVLGWLLVASLRRPARAAGRPDYVEARRAFARFQLLLVGSAALIGIVYHSALDLRGLGGGEAELMLATLGQGLLLVETLAATALLLSRRREGRGLVAGFAGVLMLAEAISIGAAYVLESQHVTRWESGALPLLLNADVSIYWIAFFIGLWALGLALIFTALLRERDHDAAAQARAEAAAEAAFEDADDDEEEGMPGRRLLH